MVSLEGIVTKCSLVRPKIIQSVHYSEKKDRFLSRKYRDQTMTASGATSLNVYPKEDDEGNPVCVKLQFTGLWKVANLQPSLLLSTDTLPTWIINRYPSKKCPSEPPPVNFPAVLT